MNCKPNVYDKLIIAREYIKAYGRRSWNIQSFYKSLWRILLVAKQQRYRFKFGWSVVFALLDMQAQYNLFFLTYLTYAWAFYSNFVEESMITDLPRRSELVEFRF